MPRSGAVVVLLAASACAAGQHLPAAPRARLRSSTSLVLAPVSVRGATGGSVPGLPRDAFLLSVDGAPRMIDQFWEEEGPLALGIVFDASRSMEARLRQSREAVARLFETAIPGDEYLTVTFNDQPRVVCELTADFSSARASLDAVLARGWTSLFDAIFLSAERMRQASNSRRALVVLSDGEDNHSRYTSRELRAYLREAGVRVFALGLLNGPFSGWSHRALRQLTEETGGWFRPVRDMSDLTEAVREVSQAARAYYMVGFAGDAAATGRYRKIRVSLDRARYPSLAVTARDGYYSTE